MELQTPFLTALDSRASVKGSRDPLGLQSIWSRLGRHVVGNLTTVSTSVTDFTTLLLGLYFAEQLSPGMPSLDAILRWEQLAAYARHCGNKEEEGLRGIERVKRNVSDGATVTVSAARNWQILGNQQLYGIWGLYTMPARASGLIDDDALRLTPPTSEWLAETHAKFIATDGPKIRKVLANERTTIAWKGKDQELLARLGAVLRPTRYDQKAREFYRRHLLHDEVRNKTNGLQHSLVTLLEPHFDETELRLSPVMMQDLVEKATAVGLHPLADRLHRIRICESVIALASDTLGFLLARDGQPIARVASALREQWGQRVSTINAKAFPVLQDEISQVWNDDIARRWTDIGSAFAQGDYAPLVSLLVAQNRAVMRVRGSPQGWLDEEKGVLKVRFRDERRDLPTHGDLPELWRFPYFITSLHRIGRALREPRR